MGKEQGYMFIFDSSVGLLYQPEGEDISAKLMEKAQPCDFCCYQQKSLHLQSSRIKNSADPNSSIFISSLSSENYI